MVVYRIRNRVIVVVNPFGEVLSNIKFISCVPHLIETEARELISRASCSGSRDVSERGCTSTRWE